MAHRDERHLDLEELHGELGPFGFHLCISGSPPCPQGISWVFYWISCSLAFSCFLLVSTGKFLLKYVEVHAFVRGRSRGCTGKCARPYEEVRRSLWITSLSGGLTYAEVHNVPAATKELAVPGGSHRVGCSGERPSGPFQPNCRFDADRWRLELYGEVPRTCDQTDSPMRNPSSYREVHQWLDVGERACTGKFTRTFAGGR